MRNTGFNQVNKLRHSLKNFGKGLQGKDQMIQGLSTRVRELQRKIVQMQNEKVQTIETNKILSFQIDTLNDKIMNQEEQLNEAEDQLNDAEGELQDVNLMKATLEDQKYELIRKSEEIKQLNRRVSELKQDVFYRNKNVFDHNLLKMELNHQKLEAEALRGRIVELEESCASLRIEGEITHDDPVEKENHFTKKVFKLETKINEMKRLNEELRKGSRNMQNQLKSSFISEKNSHKDMYSNKRKYKKPEIETPFNEKDETVYEKMKELKDKVSQVEMEKKIYMDKNSELIQEIEKLRSQGIKNDKMKNNSLIDDREFKKRLNKYRMENHELKDKLHEMETKLRNWETEHRLNDNSRHNNKSEKSQDKSKTAEIEKRLQIKEREIKNLKNERDELLKKIDRLKFELEEKEKEVKTLEYRIMGEEDNDIKVQNLIKKNSKLGERIMELESQIKKMIELQSMNSSGYPDKELDQILNE